LMIPVLTWSDGTAAPK